VVNATAPTASCRMMEIGAEVTPHCEERAGQQQWRQKRHQREVGVELDLWRFGYQCERYAAQHERGSWRQPQTPSRQLQHNDGGQQEED
jgi:hypothetical protein